MEARAALWTLHPTITGKEITAHAQGKAVGLIPAEKLVPLDLHDWLRLRLRGQLIGMPVVQDALYIVQIHNPWVLLLMGCPLVDLLKPFHLAVTEERIQTQEKLGNSIADIRITWKKRRKATINYYYIKSTAVKTFFPAQP